LVESPPVYTVESFTASDGYRLQYRRYHPIMNGWGAPRARIVCLHGIQSHAGWYDYSCTGLCRAGFLVDFLDRRGSGMNDQARGDAPSYRQLLDDVTRFLPTTRTHSALPTFLLAISWGGKLALGLTRAGRASLQGIVLLCPGFFPVVSPPLRQRLAIGWARLVAPRRRFPIPLNDPQVFTENPKWQQFIREDKLSLHEATARLLTESVRLDRYVRRAGGHCSIPVLLMLAEKDRIINNQKTRRYVEAFASPDKEIMEYPGAHHTLEFEPNPEIFLADLIGWLERHLRIA